jgi:hypothetical protein
LQSQTASGSRPSGAVAVLTCPSSQSRGGALAVPVWQAPVPGLPALAGSINQLLGTHPTTFLYEGILTSSVTTGTTGIASNGLWLAQRFTTGASQSAVGYVTFPSGVTGSPAPWTVSLQADAGGQPSGTPLASVQFPKELAASEVTALLPCAVTASAQYWIVAQAAGDSSDYYAWGKSTAASGCVTAPDGRTWTAQAFGLRYSVYDQSPAGPLIGIAEDGGARYTLLGWTGSYGPTAVQEFTVGQTASGYAESARSLSYSGGLLTGIA